MLTTAPSERTHVRWRSSASCSICAFGERCSPAAGQAAVAHEISARPPLLDPHYHQLEKVGAEPIARYRPSRWRPTPQGRLDLQSRAAADAIGDGPLLRDGRVG